MHSRAITSHKLFLKTPIFLLFEIKLLTGHLCLNGEYDGWFGKHADAANMFNGRVKSRVQDVLTYYTYIFVHNKNMGVKY